MNRGLRQFILLGNKRRHWYERYFNGKGVNWMWPTLGGIGLAAGLGAGLMYILDPDRGRSRRAFARDKVTSAVNKTGAAISRKSHDLKDRARGVIAETGSYFQGNISARESELRQ